MKQQYLNEFQMHDIKCHFPAHIIYLEEPGKPWVTGKMCVADKIKSLNCS